MSYTISYITLFKVRAIESVSLDPLEEIIFIPSRSCIEKLDNHRLIFKPLVGGFDVHYQTNPQAVDPVLAPISRRTRFSFLFTVTGANFFRKYEPDFDDSPQLYFDNLDNTGAILSGPTEILSEGGIVQTSDAVKIYPRTFDVKTDMTIAPTPGAYLIKEKFSPGGVLQTVPINNPLGFNNVSTKVNDPVIQETDFISESGPYVLETDSGQPPQRTIYLDDQLAKQHISGVADIYWDNSQSNAAPDGNEYQIRFKLR